MGRSAPESDVELLESSDGPPAPEFHRVATSTPRTVVALLGAVVVGAVAWLIASSIDAEPESAAPTTVAPATTIPDVEAGGDAEGETTTSQTIVAADDVVLNAVVSSPTGGGAWLVTMGDNGRSDVVDLPDLADFSFDSSGEWIAGIAMGTRLDRPLTLWAGRVGTPMEPIAVDVASYAWHDERPGELAWTDVDRSEVVSLDLRQGLDAEVTTRQLETAGRLRGWGSWGYAIETWADGHRTAVVDPDGVVLEDLVGQFRGRLADGDLVVAGGPPSPVRYSPSTDSSSPVSWLNGGDDVSSLIVTPDGDSTVAFVVRGNEAPRPSSGEVLVVSAEEVITVGLLDGSTTIALDDDGTIALVDQDPSGQGDEPGRFTLLVDGAAAWSSPVPDVFLGREWVVALAMA